MTGQDDLRTEVEEALSTIERVIMTDVETQALRVPAFEAFKSLIVTGNTCLFLPDEGGAKNYRLDQYVVKRDPMGNVIEIIIRETVHPESLPDSIRESVLSKLKEREEMVDLYTRVLLKDGRWEVSQECMDEEIPEGKGSYPKDNCPWLVLRWTSIAGEDYGRGLIEEYLGDLMTLEALTKAITEGSVVAARILFLVNPNGTTRPSKITSARNGAVIEGNAADVTTLQMDKFADFSIAAATAQRIEQRLSYAFLLMQSVQRDAERVTAEEIRTLAKELEDSLGGVYSVLAQEFQLPLVRRLMKQNKNLPELPKGVVNPAIVTGLEALGRGNDLQKLVIFMEALEPIKDLIQPYLVAGDYATRVATSLGMDKKGLIRSEEEVQALMQQQQLQQAAQSVAPGVAQEIAKGAVQQPQGGE